MIRWVSGPVARIVLRYIAGMLAGWAGYAALSDLLANDPDVSMLAEAALAFLLSAVTGWAAELWYRLAKRMGWPT